MTPSPIEQNLALDQVGVYNAQVHNLKHLTLHFPQHKFVVITGVSGSGKSSLAFDTLFAEGQYRYAQTFSSYARGFIGGLNRPDVDKIEGLQPVISIEQKTTIRNPRSTLGTSTEVHDYLRVLYARVGIAYAPSGARMVEQTVAQIQQALYTRYQKQSYAILAPLVRGRKGHHQELLGQCRRRGYTHVRINDKTVPLTEGLRVDRFVAHDIALYIDQITPTTPEQQVYEVVDQALHLGQGLCSVLVDDTDALTFFSTRLVDPVTGLSYPDPAPNTFSFNSPQGACKLCKGLGVIRHIALDKVIPDPTLSLAQGGMVPAGVYTPAGGNKLFYSVRQFLAQHNISMHQPLGEVPEAVMQVIIHGNKKNTVGVMAALQDLFTAEGVIGVLWRAQQYGNKSHYRADEMTQEDVCSQCDGARLQVESLCFKLDGYHIAEVSQWSLDKLYAWLEGLMPKLNDRQQRIAVDLLKELGARVKLLVDLGLHYLCLDRPFRTLSGGEAQRARLATQLGSQLVGVMYILDEPSIGLHARDNDLLIQALRSLRDMGNTVVVVEHDRDMMLASDYLLDIGPGAGRYGGEVVAAGIPSDFLKQDSLTAQYLTNKRQIPRVKPRAITGTQRFELRGARGNNLKNVTLSLPLGRMTCLTGVSGSGKSTLVHDTLVRILARTFHRSHAVALPYDSIVGVEHLDKVIEIDQKPIGRTSRSNPATYTSLFDDIRRLFAQLPEAKVRGYTPSRFSFNVRGGRCTTCEGVGFRSIEMGFLPTMRVPCEVCEGTRYNAETLEVRYKGLSIAQILALSVKEALVVFEAQPIISQKIGVMNDVGLGYIHLGQHATTLSGGEAQRVKLSAELLRKDTAHTLYVLDEPTTGLHFEDIILLLRVLHRLVDKGNTVLIIEHNLEVIASADYVIDMGPEGGELGGEIIAKGTPKTLAQRDTPTGKYLAAFLQTLT